MAMNTFKCNHLMPLHSKGLMANQHMTVLAT